jgi:glycosyltransferase involved in cell wall biosynthesis
VSDLISFIITSRNENFEMLKDTVKGLRESARAYRYEIIIFDDGSEESFTISGEDSRVIRSNTPLGASVARKIGAEKAKGEVLVWLDAHMTFGYYWLEKMLDYVGSGSLLCSAAWNYELSKCFCWGTDVAWWNKRDYQLGRSPGFCVEHRTRFPGHGAQEVPSIIGACYMLSREGYEKLGGFAGVSGFWCATDFDLSFRAWICGLGVKCVTNADVGHFYRDRFPYYVDFDMIETGQLMILRTIFESDTIRSLEKSFDPVPKSVQKWFEKNRRAIYLWRDEVQSRRVINDAEFIRKRLPTLLSQENNIDLSIP